MTSSTDNTTETSKKPKEPSGDVWLGIFPKKYRSLYVIATLDTICGTLLRTHASIFLKVCFTLRVTLTSVAVWGNIHEHSLLITLTPFVYFFYLFAFVIHFTSAVFSKDFFETTVWTTELSSYLSSVALFYCIVWLQIDFEMARADVEFLEDLQAKGRINKLLEWEEKKKDKKKQQFWVQVGKLAEHFKKRWNYLAWTGVGIALSQIFDVCKTMIDANLCQSALHKDAPRVLYLLKLRMLCVFVKSIAHSIQAYYQRMVREYVNYDMRKLSMTQALEQEVGYYDEVGSSSEVHGVAWNKVGRITSELGWHLRCMFEFLVKTVMIIICMMQTDIRFTILLTTMSPVLMTTHQYFSEHCKRLGHLLRDNWEELDRRVSEAIHNIRTLKVFGAEEVELDYIHNLTTECFDKLWMDIVYCEARWGFCSMLQNTANVFLYYYSYQMLLSGEIDMATVYVFSSFEGHISWMMNTLSHFFSRTNRLLFSSYKVFKLLERETTHTFAEPGVKPACSGKFEFQNVCMAYPTASDKVIVDKLSLTINPGEMVAFVGESGCGKSTVLSMMNFMYANQKGQVLLDEVPLTEWNKQYFYENVVTVPQDSILFARTIEDNIKFGRQATREEVVEAAKKANCHDFVEEMERGYMSIVGERGTNLSGGQKQRISIARALLRKPKVLLLDEATSALDTKSERCVQAALHDLMENNDLSMSIVVIAHRLSTVRKADRIVVFGKGARIIESGNHEYLMSKGGHYAELVNQQKLTDTPMDNKSDAAIPSKEAEDQKLSDKKPDAEHELDDAMESEDEPTEHKPLTPLAMEPVVTG